MNPRPRALMFGIAVVLAVWLLSDMLRSLANTEANDQSTDETAVYVNPDGDGNDLPTASDDSLASSARDDFLISDVNSAFRAMSPEALRLVEPTVESKYFANGDPNTYRRHQLWEIDIVSLKDQLEQSWRQWDASNEKQVVSLPLFPDTSVDVAVVSWKTGSFGTASAFGFAQEANSQSNSVSFHISDTGSLQSSIQTTGGGFLIEQVTDGPYYIVFDLDTSDDTYLGID